MTLRGDRSILQVRRLGGGGVPRDGRRRSVYVASRPERETLTSALHCTASARRKTGRETVRLTRGGGAAWASAAELGLPDSEPSRPSNCWTLDGSCDCSTVGWPAISDAHKGRCVK